MIVEMFNRSMEKHGVIYSSFIADGDSNVFAQIKQHVSYGRQVKKIQCANHKVKCFTGTLYKICKITTLDSKSRNLLKSNIPRLKRDVRSAIRYCHENSDSIQDLQNDLKNLPHHIFGDHSKCRDYFKDLCNKKEHNVMHQLEKTNALNESVYSHIKNALQPLLDNAPTLILNLTSNRCEYYMSLLAACCNGKRADYTRSNSFRLRAISAALKYARGANWILSPFKRHHGKSPGPILKKRCQEKAAHTERNRASKKKWAKERKKKTKSAPAGLPDENYGAIINDNGTTQYVDDMDPVKLVNECSAKLETLQVKTNPISLIFNFF